MRQPVEDEAQPGVTLWMQDLDQPLSPGPTLQIPVVFTRAGPEVTRELALAMSLDDPAVVLRRFERGRHCYIGRIAGALVSYGWVTFDEEEIGEVDLSIRLKAGEAYIWHCATLPAHRGQRLYSALLTHMIRALRQEGLHRVWIGTDNNNLPSQNGAALAGFRPICEIVIARTSTAFQVWMNGRPDVPAQLLRDARSALTGEPPDARLADKNEDWKNTYETEH